MLLDSRDVALDDELSATVFSTRNSPTPIDPSSNFASAVMPDVGALLLNRWRLVAWAGLGTANVVFRGEHVDMTLPVAVKIVNRHHPFDRELAVGHLRNEAHLLARWRHPNLPRLWDFHEDGDYPLMVTDFIDGLTLRQMIRLEGRVDPRRAVRAALQVTEALAVVWRDEVIHRDVKPENILLAAGGSAKLIDFGLAVVRGEENSACHGETALPPRVGTVAYLAPEQARNSAAVDHRADMYSLGATLYHAVTGRLPFSGDNAAQVILRHIEDAPIPPGDLAPGLPQTLSDLILRMMAKDPQDRFADAGELIAALETLQVELSR